MQDQTKTKNLDVQNLFSLLDSAQRENLIKLIGVAIDSYFKYNDDIDKVIDFFYTIRMDYDDMAEICKEARVTDDCSQYSKVVEALDKKIDNMRNMKYAIQSIYQIVNNS
jgi:hypothetical protein